jgi:holin-like protein
MKYIKQISIILLFSFAGEVCHAWIPLPIPASIYGMVLLLLSFLLKIIKVDVVEEPGAFLVSIMPVMFVAPAVGLMACWDLIQPHLIPIAVVVVATTAFAFGVAGMLTKLFRKRGKKNA